MKKSLLFVLAIIFLINLNADAQCTGCTASVTGLSASPYLVSSGQKLCITSTGTITGIIAVNGGTLCNQGTINNARVLVYNGGVFTNNNVADIDSLLIQDNNSNYINWGTSVHIRFSSITGSVANNYMNLTTDYLGDSIGNINNFGDLKINFNFYNTSGGVFNNFKYLKINGVFYNSSGGTVSTNCKVDVVQNFYNAAILKGATGGCGGFNIGGFSANSGTVGLSGFPIDICDAGSPTSFDANSGDITNATFCLCTNSCMPMVGIKENKNTTITKVIFPNPCLNKCVTEYSETISSVTIFNELGQVVKASVAISDNKVELNSSNLKSGIYFIEATSASGKVNRQKLIVE